MDSSYAQNVLASHVAVICKGLRSIIEEEDDLKFVGKAENGYLAQKLCKKVQPQVVVIDASLPGPSSGSLVDNLLACGSKISILIFADSIEHIDVRALVEKGVSGCILQDEPDVLISNAIRTVGLGGIWFSKPLLDQVLEPSIGNVLNVPKQKELTCRESEVTKLIAEGLSNKEIAYHLKIKEGTVEFHVTNIFRKLNVTSRVAVATWVMYE